MTPADQVVVAGRARQPGFALGPVISRARQVARRHPVLLAAAALVVGGGGAAVAVSPTSSSPVPAIASDCGRSIAAPGFHVFACMSGGARVGRPHPKELLVVRSDGSSSSYPRYAGTEFAVRGGEVVATYDLGLVRVTRSRLVPLVTERELARALRLRPAAIMAIYDPRVDARGDVYFVASVLRPHRRGCRSPLLERTVRGAIRQIRSSTSRNSICS
jgi:hypothetical protein